MLYYTSLFLVIVLVSVIAIWMYRAILGASRVAYKASVPGGKKISPRTRTRLKARAKARAKAAKSGTSEAPVPWGWKGNPNPIHSHHETHKPGSSKKHWNGLSHSHAAASEHTISTPPSNAGRKNVGWPYKEEKMEFAGKAYKVNRKAVDGDFNGNGKPWVW